jgi:hypothetical protein
VQAVHGALGGEGIARYAIGEAKSGLSVQMNRMDDAMGSLGGASINRQMMQHDRTRAKVRTMHTEPVHVYSFHVGLSIFRVRARNAKVSAFVQANDAMFLRHTLQQATADFHGYTCKLSNQIEQSRRLFNQMKAVATARISASEPCIAGARFWFTALVERWLCARQNCTSWIQVLNRSYSTVCQRSRTCTRDPAR